MLAWKKIIFHSRNPFHKEYVVTVFQGSIILIKNTNRIIGHIFGKFVNPQSDWEVTKSQFKRTSIHRLKRFFSCNTFFYLKKAFFLFLFIFVIKEKRRQSFYKVLKNPVSLFSLTEKNRPRKISFLYRKFNRCLFWSVLLWFFCAGFCTSNCSKLKLICHDRKHEKYENSHYKKLKKNFATSQKKSKMILDDITCCKYFVNYNYFENIYYWVNSSI